MKKKKSSRFPNYERVDTTDIVTFGTSVFIRKDKQALIIVFPCGNELHFKPEDEIQKAKSKDEFINNFSCNQNIALLSCS